MCGDGSHQEEMFEVDLSRVARAFRKIGMMDYWQQDLSEAEKTLSRRKGYSAFQWKLEKAFRKMLDEELYLYKLEQEAKGKKICTYGLNLRKLTNCFPRISEKVFCEWAMRIGINHLYAYSLGDDLRELRGRIFQNSSDHSIYDRFECILHHLYATSLDDDVEVLRQRCVQNASWHLAYKSIDEDTPE